MQVISSKRDVGVPQKDGRIWVSEIHTIDDGTKRYRTFLADLDLDLDWHMNLTATQLDESFIREEERLAKEQADKEAAEASLKSEMLNAADIELQKLNPESWKTDSVSNLQKIIDAVFGKVKSPSNVDTEIKPKTTSILSKVLNLFKVGK